MNTIVKPRAVLNSGDIRRAMASRWAAPEYAIMWEVGDATGARHTRFADAVVMSLWPSRGLELHGVEIKVSRSDWKREAADPRKAETIARFCDRWYVHTPTGIVQDLSELPPAWGLREYDGRAWRTIKEAEKTQAELPSRAFLAAMLRRADETMRADIRSAAERSIADQRDKIEAEIAKRVEYKTRDVEALRKNIEAFETAFGEKIHNFDFGDNYAKIGRMARALVKAGISDSEYGLRSQIENMQRQINDLKESLDALPGQSDGPK